MRRILAIFYFLSLAGSAFATTRASDGSVSDINAKIAASSTGDTVTIPAGTFTWGAGGVNVDLNKAITLQGAGQGSTTINMHADLAIQQGALVVTAAATIRGFRINQTAPKWVFLGIYSDGWRFTDLDIRGATGGGRIFHFNNAHGLVDNCNINWYTECIFVLGKTTAWSTANTMGTAQAVFFESNNFYNDASNEGYIDGNIDASFVARFNTVQGIGKFDGHGYFSNYGNSCRQTEIYYNTLTTVGVGSNYSVAEIRGGTGMVFMNRGADGTFYGRGVVKVTDYGVMQGGLTPSDYPIAQQVGTGYLGAATEPLFIWGNRRDAANGYIYGMSIVPGGNPADVPSNNTWSMDDIIKPNRDYYFEPQHWNGNGASMDPFTATSGGVGIGTAAQMAAITPTINGVGFWVTDEGSWRAGYSGTSGRLYRWNGTAWALYYTPYTYPHPARGAETEVYSLAANPSAGTYNSTQSLTLTTTTEGASIYYTTDGSTPDNSKTLYTGAITITGTTQVKAIGIKSGLTSTTILDNTYTIVGATATPVATPSAGTYPTNSVPFTVALTCLTPSSTIYYTTNGTTPTTASAVYSSPITVSATMTIKAMATASGSTDSAVLTALFNISDIVGIPYATPAGGNYVTTQSVTLASTTSGATIYYAINATPTTGSTVYTAPISVTSTQTINALAAKSGLTNSAVMSETYTISTDVGYTTIGGNTGAFGSSRLLTASFTAPLTGTLSSCSFYGANSNAANDVKWGLYRDVNGDETAWEMVSGTPTEITNIGVLTTGWHPFTVSFAITSGQKYRIAAQFSDGASVTGYAAVWDGGSYSRTSDPAYGDAWTDPWGAQTLGALTWSIKGSVEAGTPTVATPSASVATGSFTNPQTVSLTCSTSGASIYYTLDGSTPTTSSYLYSSALTVSRTTNLRAIGSKSGLNDSAVMSEVYTFPPAGLTATTLNVGTLIIQ